MNAAGKLCARCHTGQAGYFADRGFRGQRWNKDHDLCGRCYRSEQDRQNAGRAQHPHFKRFKRSTKPGGRHHVHVTAPSYDE